MLSNDAWRRHPSSIKRIIEIHGRLREESEDEWRNRYFRGQEVYLCSIFQDDIIEVVTFIFDLVGHLTIDGVSRKP